MVTPVCGTYQCAEIDRITLGLGMRSPMRRQASVKRLSSRAFMGLPCPKKIAGNSSVTGGTAGKDLKTHLATSHDHGKVTVILPPNREMVSAKSLAA